MNGLKTWQLTRFEIFEVHYVKVLGTGEEDMATKYNLQPNESMIMSYDRVSHGGSMAGYTDELLLTNLNIVFLDKGMFGKVKNIQVFPLNHIKVFNGQAQVLLGRRNGLYVQIDIYFLNGQESFGFERKKEALKWIANINKLVTGSEGEIDTSTSGELVGVENIAGALKETMDAFKGVFSDKSKSRIEVASRAVAKCTSCGAPISGNKGEVASCQYCDTKHQL